MMSTNKKPESSSCPFAGAKKAPKRKKSSKRLSKDRAKDLAASDEGSYFEQEQLLSLTTKDKDESQDDDEMVSASHAKILQIARNRKAGIMTKNDWPNNCVREWSERKPCEISYLSFLSFRCDFARECFCEIRT